MEKDLPTSKRTFIIRPGKSLGIPNWVEEVEAIVRREAEKFGAYLLRESLNLKVPVAFLQDRIRATVKEKVSRWATHPPKQVNLKGISEEDLQWLVGFWEGDGTITLSETSYELSITQKEPQVLYIIQGLLQLPTEPTKNSSGWSLYLGGKASSLPLITLLCENLVSPQRVTQLNKTLSSLSIKLEAKGHGPSPAWVAGFWDADGHSTCDTRTITIGFTQKNREVLDKIEEEIGGGSFYPYRKAWMLYWNGPNSKTLASHLKRYSKDSRKKEKLLVALACLALVNPTYRKYYDDL